VHSVSKTSFLPSRFRVEEDRTNRAVRSLGGTGKARNGHILRDRAAGNDQLWNIALSCLKTLFQLHELYIVESGKKAIMVVR
jgi:hypothetical protein